MKRGFTLAEVAVASVIVLVVLTTLAIALNAFMKGSHTLELQDGALTLARVEMASIERSERVPELGTSLKADSLWGNVYQVNTTVRKYENQSTDVIVAVTSGDSVSIELSRRFYE